MRRLNASCTTLVPRKILAAGLVGLAVVCMIAVDNPALAQEPPDPRDARIASTDKADSNISSLLRDSVNEFRKTDSVGSAEPGARTRNAATSISSTSRAAKDLPADGEDGAVEDGPATDTGDDLVRFDEAGNVQVYIHLKSTDEAALQRVRRVVARVEIENLDARIIQTWVPVENLEAIAALDVVRRVTLPDYGVTRQGRVITEGDAVHRSNLVRDLSGLSGKGVKIGVISDGVEDRRLSQARGELPSSIEINPNLPGYVIGYEGTALLEIVHDLAPEAELAFSGAGTYLGPPTSLGMAQAILWLANDAFGGEGADVIVDDFVFYSEPYFEDGIVAQAAADAVAGGAVFVSAAGNAAERHYEGEFVDGGDGFHAFGGSSDTSMRVVGTGFGIWVILQWSDRFGSSGNDYDLYVCDPGRRPTTVNRLNGFCRSSADLQNGDDDPLEVVGFPAFFDTHADVYIKRSGGQARRLEVYVRSGYPIEHGVPAGSIWGHPAVQDVLAVGAVDEADPGHDDLEPFSSQGPSRIYFPTVETRAKPDVVAADGVSTSSVFFRHFFGTSAAAPHVAGIAALLIEAQRLADPSMTKKEVADAVVQGIRDSAIDLGDPGHDAEFGYGRADALAAWAALSQHTETRFTVDSTGDGADGDTSDGVCDDGNGRCTLRAAIQEVNEADDSVIEFNIPGSGTQTIQLGSALPTVSKRVLIDGFSQPGAGSASFRIQLDGTNAGTSTDGLTISGTNTRVRGLVINRFGGRGIVLEGSRAVLIEENRIGTNVTGTADLGNGMEGVYIRNTPKVVLRKNLISGNDSHGVSVCCNPSAGLVIDDNIIGSDASEASDLGNSGAGIHILHTIDIHVFNNTISGNDSHGVVLTGHGAERNRVYQNYIGTNKSGASIPNSGSGVYIAESARGSRVFDNVIAHNAGDGVTMLYNAVRANTIKQNSIYSNGGLGIDLGDDGVTSNHAGDTGLLPIYRQNYPILLAAGFSADAGSIEVRLVSTRGPLTVDFYASDTCDSSGSGEGKEWIGFAEVGYGSGSDVVADTFSGNLSEYKTSTGTYITATVTRIASTSEFSPCIESVQLPRLTLTNESLEVTEDSTTQTTYTVALASQPSHDATVELSLEGELSIGIDPVVTFSPDTLTFTTSDWSIPQTITVTATSDDDAEDAKAEISHRVTIDGKAYAAERVPVQVLDDDLVVLSLTDDGTIVQDRLVVLKEGDTFTYPVVLIEQPDDDVTIDIMAHTENLITDTGDSGTVSVSPESMTFTTGNYGTPQAVTITASTDNDAEDTRGLVIHATGPTWIALTRVVIIDSDRPQLTFSDEEINVDEGETSTYTIVPESEPSIRLVINLTSSDTDAVTVSPSRLTFTTGTNGNWETPQTVTVTGMNDDDGFDNVATIEHSFNLDGRQYESGDVTVTVADGNRAPFFEDGPRTSRSVLENSLEGTAVGEPVVATDLDGDILTLRLVSEAGGPFNIDSDGQVSVGAGLDLDFEAPTTQRVKISATDPGGLMDSVVVEIVIIDANDPPEISGSSKTDLTYRENSTHTLYTYRATDLEKGPISWSLAGPDDHDFNISAAGVLTFGAAPDFEKPTDSNLDNTYEIQVVATDDQDNTDSVDVSVRVSNDAEGVEPTISTRRPPSTYRENGSSTVYTFRASDPQRSPIAWSHSGSDADDFTITRDGSGRGLLAFNNRPDFENPTDADRDNAYELWVTAEDEDGHRDRLYFTISVTDVNEAPEVSGQASFTIAENQNLPSPTYTALDPEGEAITRWSLSGTDGGDFTITENGELSFRNVPDYDKPADSGKDNVYTFSVRASDGRHYGYLPVTVTVEDVNEPPTITTISRSATELSQNENRTSRLYTYRATDPEGGAITWTVGGVDRRFFAIDDRGQFAFSEANPPNFEQPGDAGGNNVYEVEIEASDGLNTGSLAVEVTVREVDEGPEVSGPSTYTIAENQSLSNAVYTARDPEGGTVTRWTVGGRDGGDFTISETGVLAFRNVPDYERPADSNRDNVYEVQIRPYDGRRYGSFDVTVTVTDVNEPPEITTTSTSATALRQNENRISRLYTYRASDPEGGTITWTVGGVDGRYFAIDERGQFSFSASTPPDFEQPGDLGGNNVYEVEIQASDGSNTGSLAVEVTVREVDEGPEVTGPSTFTIAENQSLSNAAYTATDPEGGNVARWNVGGRDGGDFFITQGGTLFLRSLPDYERPADSNRDNVYEVQIRPYDGRRYGSFDVTVTVTEVDEPPEIRSGSRTYFTQPEKRTSRLYAYSATDPERGTVTWSVGGTDRSHFTLDERGQLAFNENNPPDFDAPGDVGGDNIYNVTVQARDDQFNSVSLPVTVTVTQVDEGPVITRQGNAPGSVPENHAVTQVLARYAAADPERPSVPVTRWSTAGRDSGDFVINALGQLRFRKSPDYERPDDANRDNVYEVTIRASDGRYTGILEDVQTVTVTDVDEPPTITTTSRTAFSQPENRTSTLSTFRATDPEGGTVTWTATGSDGSAFTMDERGALAFANPPDFDTPGDADGDNVYHVTVQARDASSNTASLDVAVSVTDHNEGVEPTISTRRPPSTYRENGTSAVYTFRASDPQRGAITWRVTGTDSSVFTITRDSSGRGVLAFVSPPDFESPADGNRDNDYELAVVATDDAGHTDMVAFTIAVTDHNEGVEPTISTRRPPSTYRENNTSTVYTFRASDPQRGAIRWSLTGTDADDFAIVRDSSGRGILSFDDPPDFENAVDSNQDNEYELTVVATDDDNHTDRVVFTIAVTDVNEGPEIRLEGTATTGVPENDPNTQVLAKYTATDPENPTAGIFRWRTVGRDSGDFVINELGELRFRSSPDYERPADANRDNIYEVTVQASDGRSYGMLAETLIVTVRAVNEAPVITTTSRTAFTLRENSTSVLYTYRATDQDTDDVITWSVGGTDGEVFAIYNGILSFRLLPDFENPVDADEDNVYEITVVAGDGAGLQDTVNAVITITDQSEGPVIAGRTSFTVTENYDIAQALGFYAATDAKDNRPVFPRWSLSGRDGGDFVIDGVSGTLAFRNTPDYDRPADSNRDNIYEVTIRAYDGVATGNLNVTANVTNVNEAPTITTISTSATALRQNENRTSRLYTYRARDPEGSPITWTVGGVDRRYFAIDDRGQFSFSESTPPDFEQPGDAGGNNVYEVEIQASDGLNTGSLAVTVTVREVDEGPEVSGQQSLSLTENQTTERILATYSARDPEDPSAAITRWSLSGSDAGDFTITESGELSFRNVPDYDKPADSGKDNVYNFSVRASDGRYYGHLPVTVTVSDVNEPPTITTTSTSATALRQDENRTSRLYTYRATDPEGETIIWTVGGVDGRFFAIDDRGQFSFSASTPPDFEQPGDAGGNNVYEVEIEASDGLNTGSLAVTVTVREVDEGPEVSGPSTYTIDENQSLSNAVYTATDPEGDTVTRWTVGGRDGGDFTITETGVLTFRNVPDYDKPADSNRDNVYEVQIRPYDGRHYGAYDVTVTVTDVNEAPTITTISRSATELSQNENRTSRLYTYRATDPEGGTITWSVGGVDRRFFAIDDRGRFSFSESTPPDFEQPGDAGGNNVYEVEIEASDGLNTGSLAVTVTVRRSMKGRWYRARPRSPLVKTRT